MKHGSVKEVPVLVCFPDLALTLCLLDDNVKEKHGRERAMIREISVH
ncbi:MAG: hypothetical protein P8I86_05975 [Luminiphilus sp.]|nr:hypothetical protein [Luminiphilus sp.]MDG2036624.1 hypothetical protein [Luminiphilus sp.]